jgi:ABC-2 type transport system ATP-binding protein
MIINKIDETIVHYKTTNVHLKAITFTSLITVIVGANGVGKSTLLKHLIGVFGKCMISDPYRYLKDIPTFPLDVEVKTLLNAFLIYDDYACKQRQSNLIDCLRFTPFMNQPCQTLSKGNQMKLNLIIALEADVPLYLLDEPFNGLDQSSKKRLLEFMMHDQKQYILVSHIDDVIEHDGLSLVTL